MSETPPQAAFIVRVSERFYQLSLFAAGGGPAVPRVGGRGTGRGAAKRAQWCSIRRARSGIYRLDGQYQGRGKRETGAAHGQPRRMVRDRREGRRRRDQVLRRPVRLEDQQ